MAKKAGLAGALTKRHLGHIDLTPILCTDNQGIRYSERIRSGMQLELDGASR